jgi:hypothetical protein
LKDFYVLLALLEFSGGKGFCDKGSCVCQKEKNCHAALSTTKAGRMAKTKTQE